MLATAAIVEAVAAAIEELELPLVVVDPVMVAKSGDRLLDDDGVQALCAELLPLARVVTPNIPEAEVLSGRAHRVAGGRARGGAADSRDGRRRRSIIKGGHARRARATEVVDLLFDGDAFHEFRDAADRHAQHARHRLHVRVGGRRRPRARPLAARRGRARPALRRRRHRARAWRSATATARSIISGNGDREP